MLKYKELIGQTTEGFRFDGEKYDCGYGINMNNYIGKEGVIESFTDGSSDKETCFNIRFSNGHSHLYPAHLVLENHIPDIPLKELFNKISKL
jgi:hypothetical protein